VPNCQTKIINPKNKIQRRPRLLCFKVGEKEFVKLFN